jgi:hypothetical protein
VYSQAILVNHELKGETDMRKIIYLSLAVLGVVLMPLGFSYTNATTPSVPNLRGTCLWQEVKFPTSDQLGVGPATILASIHFGENGAMTMDYDVNINGTYSSTNGVQGFYTIDSTGHGSFTFTSPASLYVRTYDFRVSADGHTMYTIAQSDGTGPVTQRVSAGSCIFQEEDENRFGQHDSGLFSRR